MALDEQRQLDKVVQGVKSISSRKIGHLLWQPGYHDHALRAEEDLRATARYIFANPLRASLVERIGDYPHGTRCGYELDLQHFNRDEGVAPTIVILRRRDASRSDALIAIKNTTIN